MSRSSTDSDASYAYTFTGDVPIAEARETLTLAVMAAESLHGRARIQLDAFFTFDEASRMCVIDASTAVGRDIAQIFTGYLAREFGESTFSVRRAPAEQVA